MTKGEHMPTLLKGSKSQGVPVFRGARHGPPKGGDGPGALRGRREKKPTKEQKKNLIREKKGEGVFEKGKKKKNPRQVISYEKGGN